MGIEEMPLDAGSDEKPEESEEVKTDEIVDETKRFSEFSEKVKKTEERGEEGSRENLSGDDIKEESFKMVQSRIENAEGVMKIEEIYDLLAEGKFDGAKKETQKIEWEAWKLMKVRPDLLIGIRIFINGEVIGLYEEISKAEGARLKVEALMNLAKHQETCKERNEDGIITDCERALNILEDMEGDIEGERWGWAGTIKGELNGIITEAKNRKE